MVMALYIQKMIKYSLYENIRLPGERLLYMEY